MFKKILIANRGEIALRVIQACREMGIATVAVYSTADRDSLHVTYADEDVCIGPPPSAQSYLNVSSLLSAAEITGADAIHPGYGFLAENAHFAEVLGECNLAWIGPPPDVIRRMGDKAMARRTAAEAGVPVLPGSAEPLASADEARETAARVGFPVILKAAAGGGGRGMRIVREPEELEGQFLTASSEALKAFGDGSVYLEKYLEEPRHIEFQVFGDRHGNVIHLGERECSIQRRHQKLIEESPSVALTPELRLRMGEASLALCRAVGYQNAGTIEFLLDRDGSFYFMEMNTRIQVEHPVTEMVTGVDLVEQQVRIAVGEKLAIGQDDIVMTGHAVEARVYAEDPANGFLPTGGPVLGLREPSGPGVRVDSGLAAGTVVGSDYDPMLSKVIAHGPDRAAALHKLDRALADTAVLGLTTNTEFLRFLLADPDVAAGRLDTGLLDRRAPEFAPEAPGDAQLIAAAAYLWVSDWSTAGDDLWARPTGWRVGERAPAAFRLRAGDRTDHVYLTGTPDQATASVENGETHTVSAAFVGNQFTVTLDGMRTEYLVATQLSGGVGQLWLSGAGHSYVVEEVREAPVRPDDEHSGDAELLSPMPGSVVAVGVASGTEVTAGTMVVTVEAMKMEHALTAPTDGVAELLVAVGDQVKVGQPLARITAAIQENEQ